MTPSVGRIVHYMLTAQDADQINRRRTTGASIAERIRGALWPLGAQAHIGRAVAAGDVFPAIIVVACSLTMQSGSKVKQFSGLQVFLDGNDVFWAAEREQVTDEGRNGMGCWFEPPRVAQ